jgi:pimeloyl-ACP methyl ester carboxylesterase
MPRVELNGHYCYCEEEGAGYPLLYLQGGFGGSTAPGGASSEKPWMEALSGMYRVLSFDRRWSGRTPGPSTDLSIVTFADDALAVLDHFQADSSVVWAVSAGCAVGLTLAYHHPERVRALVLSDGSPWFSRDGEILAALEERLAILDHQGPEAAYEARKSDGSVGLRVLSAEPAPHSQSDMVKLERQQEEMRRRLASLSHSERVAGYAGELRTQKAYLGFDFSDRLAELSMPVLAIYGGRDQVFPDVEWKAYESSMPNLTALKLEGGTHGCGQSPSAVRAILAFLDSLCL